MCIRDRSYGRGAGFFYGVQGRRYFDPCRLSQTGHGAVSYTHLDVYKRQESQIRDTDMATEMVKYSNNNILAQAGQAMLEMCIRDRSRTEQCSRWR